MQRNADLTKKQITRLQLHYLYTRSFFREIAIPEASRIAFDFYLEQAKTFWLNESFYGKGMIALTHFRYGDSEFPQQILQSLRETAIYHEELGMYWKLNTGWYWYEAPIETQALLIEAFSEIDDDREAVEKMRIWLLKNKQTNDWRTTKATAEASYALLLEGGAARLAESGGVVIQLGDMTLNPEQDSDLQQEAGTGYFKTSWSGSDIKPEFGSVKISKTTDGIAWGALYWQYFEQLDKITSADTPVSIDKKLFFGKQ